MTSTAVSGALLAVAAYLVIGLALTVPVHRRWLSEIDPSTKESGLFFRLLITPGLISFWPFVIRRAHQAGYQKKTAGANEFTVSQEYLRRWHGLVSALLLMLCPAIVLVAIVIRSVPQLPQTGVAEMLLAVDKVRLGLPYGRMFQSIPAQVFLARDIDRDYVLLFQFEQPTTLPPTALYWSDTLESPGELPANAVLLDMIWGPNRHQIRLPDAKMGRTGYWIAYSFITHEAETTQVPSEFEVMPE